MRRGDVLRIATGGGGGWGHPFDREPERVLADVRGGFVSRQNAEAHYGVVLTADGLAIDPKATAARRAQDGNFYKNMAMLGGFLFLFVCGAGRLSVDGWLRGRK